MKSFLLLATLLLSSVLAQAQEEPALSEEVSSPTHVMCRNGADVRTVEVAKRSSFCETVYSKNGKLEIVSKSVSSTVCQKVLSNIQSNLTKANWSCRDISQSRVSQSDI